MARISLVAAHQIAGARDNGRRTIAKTDVPDHSSVHQPKTERQRGITYTVICADVPDDGSPRVHARQDGDTAQHGEADNHGLIRITAHREVGCHARWRMHQRPRGEVSINGGAHDNGIRWATGPLRQLAIARCASSSFLPREV